MRVTIDEMPCGFEVRSGLQYGAAPERPFWEGALFLDLLLPTPRPPGSVPAVVYLHGGGWRAGDKSAGLLPWLSPLMAANGFVAANVGYRLTDRAPFPAQIHDVKAAIRWLRAHSGEYGIHPERIGVWGDSAGGHLAALLGTTAGSPEHEGECGSPGHSTAVRAVIARCAPSEFRSLLEWDGYSPEHDEVLPPFFGGAPHEHTDLLRLASPAAFVHEGVPPFHVVHGSADETVPFVSAEILVAELRKVGADVSFQVVEGGHHNLLKDEEAAWGNEPWTDLGYQALDFFRSRLGNPVG